MLPKSLDVDSARRAIRLLYMCHSRQKPFLPSLPESRGAVLAKPYFGKSGGEKKTPFYKILFYAPEIVEEISRSYEILICLFLFRSKGKKLSRYANTAVLAGKVPWAQRKGRRRPVAE